MSATYCDDLRTKDLYAVERTVARMIEEGGTVDFHGSFLTLRPHPQRFSPRLLPLLTGVVAGLYRAHRGPHSPIDPPTVRVSRRANHGWYDRTRHEIVLPAMKFAWNDLYIAHELAHAIVGTGHNQRAAHGMEWRKMYAAVVRDFVSPEASLLLLDALDVR
jgi:putative metallohydrolase (TIGR04338 family)